MFSNDKRPCGAVFLSSTLAFLSETEGIARHPVTRDRSGFLCVENRYEFVAMRAPSLSSSSNCIRRDGWTIERQLGFLAALAEAGGWSGFAGRTAIMRHLFADILPEDVLSRASKARMNGPFWNEPSRAFIADWAGEGDTELIDVSALRAEWSKSEPHACTSSLLQAAWLARHGPPGGVVTADA